MQALTPSQVHQVSGGNRLYIEFDMDFTVAQLLESLKQSFEQQDIHYKFDVDAINKAIKDAGLNPTELVLTAKYAFKA